MANCGCNTNKDLTDKNTVKCKPKACVENLDLVSLVLINKQLEDILNEFSEVFDDFQTAMTDFCASETARFETISEYTHDISVNNADCCESMNAKLREIVDLIDAMEIGEVIHPTTTGL